ncbi:MFS transporter [Lacticaseibacillus jixiensis]|uniref:MFS transporter n=1 Tax=Lacticaseibacillus jixiensis TaxID=3231926 RepID=UPI0036F3C004
MSNRISKKVLGAVIATGLMSFCGVIVETAMNVTFPTLMREFGVATNMVQWMTTLYLLVVAAMVPLSAMLKRRFKTRSLFLVAISFFILGVALDAFAPSFGVLLLGRAVQGLGTGIALPLMFNIILEQVPPQKIGMMMGVGAMITGVAPAIGPTFGGLVASSFSWRYIFYFLLPLLVFALILGLVCIQQKNPPQAVGIDWFSVLLIVMTFCGLIYGISAGSLLVFAIGVVALIAFVWRSLAIPEPIINLRLFANWHYSVIVVAFVCLQVAALGLSFLLPNYIQLANGKTSLIAGLVVLPGGALGAVAGPLAGRWFDRVGAKLPLRTGAIAALVGVVVMWLAASWLHDGLIVGLYACFMLGIGLSYGNLMTHGLNQLEEAMHTDGNAIFNTLQQFAAAVGTSVTAAIVAAGQAGARSVAAGTIVGSSHALALLAGLLVLEAICVLVITSRKAA